MLLALASALRAIQIQHLDISQMDRLPDQFRFAYTKLHKSWRKGKSPLPPPSPSVSFFAYNEDLHLCLVKCLDAYLERTKVWRDGKNQLLLSFIQPDKEVYSSDISRWLKENLVLAGVTKIVEFGGHSTGPASTSKAELSGLSVKKVLDQGSWSNESIWQNFYHKENIKIGQDYQNLFF